MSYKVNAMDAIGLLIPLFIDILYLLCYYLCQLLRNPSRKNVLSSHQWRPILGDILEATQQFTRGNDFASILTGTRIASVYSAIAYTALELAAFDRELRCHVPHSFDG